MKYLYSKVPHWFFEITPTLNEPELRVLLVIIRQTYGWNRMTDKISYSQFMDQSGLKTRASVAKGLRGLAAKGLIEKNPKTVTAQAITIVPIESKITASVLVHEIDSESSYYEPVLVHEIDSESSYYEPVLVHEIDSQKKGSKETFKETTNHEMLSDSQRKSLDMVVMVGIDGATAKRLILKAWSSGRDSDYISNILGYVAQQEVGNPQGLIISLINSNSERIPTSKGAGDTKQRNQALHLSKYEHGGIDHKLVSSTCEICHPELLQQSEAQHAEI
jgi:hypothetical protein